MENTMNDKPESEKVTVSRVGWNHLVAERDQLRAKVEELEKRNVVMREALEAIRDYTTGVLTCRQIDLATKALSTTPVKGWVRVGELEKTVTVLKNVLVIWGPHIDQELTRLQALIEKEK
jgi:hypothetical protein